MYSQTIYTDMHIYIYICMVRRLSFPAPPPMVGEGGARNARGAARAARPQPPP